jgi:ribonuclease HI
VGTLAQDAKASGSKEEEMAVNLQMMQLNCHRSRSVFDSLNANLPAGQFICLIQEPYLWQKNVCGLDQTKLFYPRDVDARTAIFSNLPLTFHANLSGRDCSTCSVELNGQRVYFSSVYLDILKSVEEPNWLKAMSKAQSTQRHYFAAADVNAHSTLWGSPQSNPRGNELEDLIYAQGLSLINQGCKPTFETKRGSSIIDLTLTSPSLAAFVTNWKVCDEMHLSDHHLLTCQVRLTPEVMQLRKGRKLKKVNWYSFQALVDEALVDYVEPLLWSPQTIEDHASLLHNAIEAALDKVAPIVTFRPKRLKFNWWNPDLDDLKKVTRQSHRKARGSRSETDWDRYYRLRRKFKYACKKARQASWRAFTTEAETMPLAAKLNKIIRQKKHQQVGALKKPDGTFTDSSKESYVLLMSEHFPDAVSLGTAISADPAPMRGRYTHPVLVDQPDWIDDRRLRDALHSFGKDKAAGPDGIKPIILQNLPEVAFTLLARLYAAIIELHYTPTLWRKSEIVFIPKPGKTDYSSLRAYRPISLMSFLFKTLERLVQWRLETTAAPYHRNQHAFRSGHCTEHALSHMTDLAEKALHRKHVALAVFLDIQGAFDTLSSEAVERGMRKHGVEEKLTSWYTQYLRHRICKVAGQSGHYLVRHGTGQGGVLSPIVWNFTMDSFLNEFNSGQVKAIGYADDGALVVVCRKLNTARTLMQAALRKAYYWAFRTGLRFSVAKTTAVIFSEYESQLSAPLKLGPEDIAVKEQVTYLGVLFDRHLSWEPHISQKVTAAKRHLMLLRGIVGPTWGPPPYIMRWLYTCVVRPAITYGALVWAKSTQTKTVQAKIRKVQRLGLILTAPMRRNTPTVGLELITYVVPLHIRIMELAISTFNRIGRPPDGWSGKTGSRLGHLRWLDKEAKPIPHRTIQDRCVEHVWDRDFSVAIGDGDDDTTVSGLRCYTDGSLMGNAGSGVAIFRQMDQNPIYTNSRYVGMATVFQAEVHAIQMACNQASTYQDTRVTIFSDSQAAIYAINNSCLRSRTVLNAVKALQALGQRKLVHLQWIKAHNNSVGNDLADTMAKQGANNPTTQPSPILPMALVQVKAVTAEHTVAVWQKQWNLHKHCRQTRLYFPGPDRSRSHAILRFTRKETGILIRNVTGHNFMQYHRHNVHNWIDPECRLCQQADEESNHVIRDCPAIVALRLKYFGESYLEKDWAWEPAHLLAFLQDPEIAILEADPEE